MENQSRGWGLGGLVFALVVGVGIGVGLELVRLIDNQGQDWTLDIL